MKRTILVIDDDELTRRQLCAELERRFHHTVVAQDGAEALRVLRSERVDILLVDVCLPDMSGTEVLARAAEILPLVESIVITGYGSQDVAMQALRAGAIDYLEKPIDRVQLDAALGRAVERIAKREQVDSKHVVMVVEDDGRTRTLVAGFLRDAGYEVLEAGSGKIAVELATQNKVDVVVTDVVMPDMDGIDVLRTVKKIYDDIEVIIVSGHADQSIAIFALREGAVDYLRKPIDLDELLCAIERAIERIVLSRNLLYRTRELKLNAEIISKMKEQLEDELERRTSSLKSAQAQLFQASKLMTLGEMAAGIAHEINQPLSGISLAATALRKLEERGRLDQAAFRDALTDIDRCVQRMGKVIHHIRTFARQDALRFVEVDVNDSVQSAIALMAEQLRLHEIDLEVELDPDLPRISGEPHQIEQVVLNLMSNARDALDDRERLIRERGSEPSAEPREGASDAETGPTESSETVGPPWTKRLRVTTRRDTEDPDFQGSVRIGVADTGIGIPAANLSRVMEPFFTTKAVGRGTGIGLSISYGIVERHGGRIEVASTQNVGTTFEVVLPLERKAA